ncbi:hypothetical protein [Gottschalkia acidurici]|uniref:hypothetical protein n=1 Tax=Clostridium acidurici TaxID=1556 RepID=UPI0002FA03AB|nr:hypothetical protein [Gottschalkia acidurici]
MNIRTLRADEIECRVQTVKQNGCSLLLFKDARCDMKILDETFGIMGCKESMSLKIITCFVLYQSEIRRNKCG